MEIKLIQRSKSQKSRLNGSLLQIYFSGLIKCKVKAENISVKGVNRISFIKIEVECKKLSKDINFQNFEDRFNSCLRS